MCRDFTKTFETALDSGSERDIQKLLGIASSGGFDIVAKFAIHFSYLGNANNFEFLYELIMGLEDLESRKPSVTTDSVVQRLMGPLGGSRTKERMIGSSLRRKDTAEHDFRALVAESLIYDIAAKRPMKVAKHLVSAMNDPILWNTANELLGHIIGMGPWNLCYQDLKDIERVLVPSLRHPDTKRGARLTLQKLISQGGFSPIFILSPLIRGTIMPASKQECVNLLDRIDLNSIKGGSDPANLDLIDACVSAMKSPLMSDHPIKVLERLMDCTSIPLITMVVPLLSATRNERARPYALSLLSIMKTKLAQGRDLGSVSGRHMDDARGHLGSAMNNGGQRAIARFLVHQMKMEGTWSSRETGGNGFSKPAADAHPLRRPMLRTT